MLRLLLKGSILSLICLIWFIIYDRREQRRKKAPDVPVIPTKDDGSSLIPKDEADRLVEEWKETCRSVDALSEKYHECERIAKERSERLNTDYETELTEELKREFS
jgi:hypothetical protein